MCLDHSAPNVVYLARQVEGVFEIEKWLKGDAENEWLAQPITRQSTDLNVRPVIPRGYTGTDHVLWMRGRYVHYTDYQTSIVMTVPE
jgi:hypothetical protein